MPSSQPGRSHLERHFPLAPVWLVSGGKHASNKEEERRYGEQGRKERRDRHFKEETEVEGGTDQNEGCE